MCNHLFIEIFESCFKIWHFVVHSYFVNNTWEIAIAKVAVVNSLIGLIGTMFNSLSDGRQQLLGLSFKNYLNFRSKMPSWYLRNKWIITYVDCFLNYNGKTMIQKMFKNLSDRYLCKKLNNKHRIKKKKRIGIWQQIFDSITLLQISSPTNKVENWNQKETEIKILMTFL